jgi:hypothetical protein
MTGTEFMEKNLTGNRFALYKLLHQGIIQGGGNTNVRNTETLREMTQAEIEKAESEQ